MRSCSKREPRAPPLVLRAHAKQHTQQLGCVNTILRYNGLLKTPTNTTPPHTHTLRLTLQTALVVAGSVVGGAALLWPLGIW